jgi:glycosyltransferase involved in cell wall biosynthesis
MRIAMNARRLEGQRLGVGRYLEYLLKHWDRQLAADEHMDLFVRAPFKGSELGLSDKFTVRQLSPRLTGLMWESVHLPLHTRKHDVLFCPNYSAPLFYHRPCVVAIHSMNEVQSGAHDRWYKYTYSAVYKHSSRHASRVIVPAETTKRDLMRHYGVAEDRIDIVEQGADDSFHPIDDPEAALATRRRLLGDDSPYVLFVGKLSERRNIPELIRGFAQFKRKTGLPHKLLLVGPNHKNLPLTSLVAENNVADAVVQTDGRFAEHQELVPIYNAADVFIHPSLYEGFSMTTVEALACGVPVIAADRGGLADVARGYAHMLPEPDAASIGLALETVLTDTQLRDRLRVRSRERGRAFRWENTARETLAVLRRVAAQA